MLVSSVPQGLFYAVNTRAFNKRTLSSAESKAISDMLDSADLSTLASVAEKGGAYPKKSNLREESLKLLEEHGLIYTFEGAYFSSLTHESVDAMYAFRADFIPCTSLLTYIAHPILVKCVETGMDADDLLSLAMIPQDCKDYICDGLKSYKENKKCRFAPLSDEDKKGKNILKFDIIETFIGSVLFSTKEKYDAEFEREVDIVTTSFLTSDIFKAAAVNALGEFKDMTLENVKEIYEVINKKS